MPQPIDKRHERRDAARERLRLLGAAFGALRITMYIGAALLGQRSRIRMSQHGKCAGNSPERLVQSCDAFKADGIAAPGLKRPFEIGRASCRERVYVWVVG